MNPTHVPLWRRLVAGTALFALLFTLAPPPEIAAAAITVVTQPTDEISSSTNWMRWLGASSVDTAIAKFGLTGDTSETLSSVAVKLYDSNDTTLAATDFANMKLWRDNGDGVFSTSTDTALATCATLGAFGSRTSTTTISGNSCDGSTALEKALPTSSTDNLYFVSISTDDTWNDHGARMWNPDVADSFLVRIDADAIVTSANSPTVTALAGSRTINADTTAPTVGGAFVPSYSSDGKTVEVFLSDFIEKSSLECSSAVTCAEIYTISGSIAVNSATAMSGCTSCTDADAVQLTLASAATNGTTTITLADGLTDDSGNVVDSASTVTLQMNMPPMVMGLRKVDASNLILEFDQEMMDGTGCGGVESSAAYTLTIDGSTVTGSTIELQAGNKEVKFTKTNAFTNAGVDGNDYIQVETRPDDCGTPQNANGMKMQGNNWFAIDATAPRVTGLIKDEVNNKTYIKFNEVLDSESTSTLTNYTDDSSVHPGVATLLRYGLTTNPSWFTSDMTDKVVELSFTDVSTLNTKITVTNVTDMAGNVIDASYDEAVLSDSSAIGIADTGISTVFTNGKWNGMLDGCDDGDPGNTGLTCSDNIATNRDSIIIPFTGSIDTGMLGEASDGAVIPNIGSFVEIFDSWTYSGSSASDCGGDYWNGSACVGKNYANLANSYGVVSDGTGTDDVLTIYLQGNTNTWNGMEVNPAGIRGTNGLIASQNGTASKNQLPMPVFADVDFVKTSGFTQSSTVTFFFSADMDRAGIGNAADLATKMIPQKQDPWAQHSWGTSPTISWGNHDGTTCTPGGTGSDSTADCLKVTIGSSPTIADGDEIMVNGLNSTAGSPLGWGGKIDTSAPTLVKSIWNSSDHSLTLQYNEALVDLTDNDFTPHGITFTDNGGSVSISSVESVSDCSGEDMWCPFNKIKITFSADLHENDDLVFSAANISNEGGLKLPNVTNFAAAAATDAVAPTIASVMQNDWNNDGTLNSGDEIIIIFDGDSATPDTQASDVDYSTITALNTDFIVKRSSATVNTPFGSGASFWIDQWDRHAGELHINLGMGADIRAGDEIWAAANEVKDLSGNAMQSETAQFTLATTKGGEITKVVYNNADNSTLDSHPTMTADDTFVVHFNTAIDPYTLGTFDGSTGVTNIDWGLPIEHNFDANYGTSYTFMSKSWGSATGVWNAGFTQLTITLVSGHVLGDMDLVQAWSVKTATGASIRKPGVIDTNSLILDRVIGNKTLGVLVDTYDAGDKLTFIFSEPTNEASLRVDSVAHATTDLGLADGNFGDSSTFAWIDAEKKIFEVTLGGSGIDIDTDGEDSDDTSFNPAATVTDLNGNADATSSAVEITESSLQPVSNMSVVDNETSYVGIDGRDISIHFTGVTGADKYLIYIIPEFVRLDTTSQGPVAIPTTASVCDGTSCDWTGSSSLNYDSRSTTSTATFDMTKPYFPLNEWDQYDIFIVASNTTETDTSFPAKSSTTHEFSMEYGSDGQAPWVEGSMPWDGKNDVALNNKNLSVKFNEAMNRTSIETENNIGLQKKVGSDWTSSSPDNISIYVSYDETNFAAKIEPVSNLVANSEYRIVVTDSVTDQGGTELPLAFRTYFKTAGASDSTGPKVRTYFVDGQTLTATTSPTLTTVPRGTFSLSTEFDEEMNPASFTTTSVTLSPSVANSNIWYDPMMRTLNYVLGSPLAQNTEYTLTLSGVYIKDAAGNTLDGDGNGTVAGSTADNYTLTFTSANVDNNDATMTVVPKLNWIDCDTKTLHAGFSEKMKKSSVEDKSNWTLKQGSTIINLQNATFFFDGFMNELRIEGLSGLSANTEYTLTPSGSILGANGTAIDSTNDCPTHSCLDFTPWSSTTVFNSTNIQNTTAYGGGTFNGDMFAKMGNDDVAMDLDFKMFMPINVWPMNQTAGKTTNYHISFPTSQKIPHGGKILLKFPSGFDVTNAAVGTDSESMLYFFNQDINGPGGTMTDATTFNPTGKVQISVVSANNQTKIVTLTLVVDDGAGCTLDATGDFVAACTNASTTNTTTMDYDFLDFELSGIVNGDAADIDWFNDTGGYQVEISTKNASSKLLEGPIKSGKFDIKEAGSGSISGKVTASDGSTGVENAHVMLDSPMAGHQETDTDATGAYSFSGLPVAVSSNAWDGWYNIWVEAPGSSSYTGGRGFDIQLTTSAPSSTGNNVSFATANNTITFTINYAAALEGKNVMIWASGPNGWKEKKITLADTDSNSETGYSDTNETIAVNNGRWDFGINQWQEKMMFGGSMEMDFIPPRPESIEITGDTAVTQILGSADYTISGKVTDGTSGLANVQVYAYSPSGTGGGSNTQTASDGSYKLKVASGTFTVGASKPGLPSAPEKTITVASANVTGQDFAFVKSGSSVSGSVTDGTNAIQYANINAWTNDGRNMWANTDQQGAYTLFLAPGTWNIEAHAPGFGRIELMSGVTSASNISSSDSMQATVIVAADSATSGLNFSVGSATYYTITGIVKDANNSAIANAFVWADEVNSTTKAFLGNSNDNKTNSSGAFTIKVKANSASTRYKLEAWHPDYGDIKPDSATLIDVSSANSTGNYFTVQAGYTMTVSIINGDALVVDGADIGEAFVDVFSMQSSVGNHQRFKNIELSSGDNMAAGTLTVQSASGYNAMLHIPGIGEFTGTVGGGSTFAVTGNSTITFDLGMSESGSVLTFSGNVKDGAATNIQNAWVSAMNTLTYNVFDTTTDASGDFSLKVPDGTYKIRADKPGYKGTESTTLSVSSDAVILTLTTADSTITGTVYDADGTTPITQAFVWAEESDGSGWVGSEVDSSGNYSLAVPDDTNWTIFSQNETGKRGAITSATTAGASSTDVTLSTTLAGASFISDEPRVASVTPSDGGVVDDSDNTGVKITIPANALGTDSNSGNISARETASLPSTTNFNAFGGVGKEITATDSSGNPVTTLNSDVSLEFTFTKEEVESFAAASDSATQNGLEELDDLQNSYWDTTAQNWVALPTTATAYVKNDSADVTWTAMDFSSFLTNVTGEESNSANGGGEGKDFYDDYKIALVSSTDHFTTFGTITGSDSVAPATPTGLVAVASDGSVALDWDDNSEGDLMEYHVYRGTTADFSCTEDYAPTGNQLNNSATFSTSAFTDSTPTASTDYTYYYRVAAIDTSNNPIKNDELATYCSAVVTATYDYTAPVTPASPGGGGGGASLDLTTPYKLPTTESSTQTSLYRPLELSQTGGSFARPVKLYNFYSKDLAAEIPKDTKVTTSSGASYSGSIEVPKSFTVTPTESATGVKTHVVFTVGSSTDAIHFDKPVKLTIPITLDESADLSKIKVFYYDGATNSYKIAGDGGVISADKTSITVEVDHFTTFVVFETDAISVAVGSEVAVGASSASGLSDIAGQWFTNFVEKLVAWGAVSGYSDGTFRPANSTNRAEMAKIITEAFDLTIPTNLTEKPFSDVPIDTWFAPYVAAVKSAGIVSGYSDGTFQPASSINRAEALKMAIAATGQSVPTSSVEHFSDVPTDAWFACFVALAKSKNIVAGSPVQTLAATEGATLFTPTFANYLSSGSTGEGVRNLKLVLQKLGYFSGAINENYDETTTVAVKSYQAEAGIATVGSFGPITRQNLNYKIATEQIQIPESGEFVETTTYLFRPTDSVNRAEIAKIVVQAKEAF